MVQAGSVFFPLRCVCLLSGLRGYLSFIGGGGQNELCSLDAFIIPFARLKREAIRAMGWPGNEQVKLTGEVWDFRLRAPLGLG